MSLESKLIEYSRKVARSFYKIPLSSLSKILSEACEQVPNDRVLAHLRNISITRFASNEFGTMPFDELESLALDLSSFGNLDNFRRLFSNMYFEKIEEKPLFVRGKEVMDSTVRGLSPKTATAMQVNEKDYIDNNIATEKDWEIYATGLDSFSYNVKAHMSEYPAGVIHSSCKTLEKILQPKVGNRRATISYEGDYSNGMICKASVMTSRGAMEFLIGLPIQNNQALMPEHIQFNKETMEFKQANIDYILHGMDKHASFEGFMTGMKLDDLMNQMIKSASEKSYEVAEDCLSVIAKKYPSRSSDAIMAYRAILKKQSGLNKDSVKESSVSDPVYTSSHNAGTIRFS